MNEIRYRLIENIERFLHEIFNLIKPIYKITISSAEIRIISEEITDQNPELLRTFGEFCDGTRHDWPGREVFFFQAIIQFVPNYINSKI